MTRVVNAVNSVLHIGQSDDLMLNYIVDRIPKKDAIILLTGVGKCYPLLRSHKILNDLHDRLADGIVLMMFPGRYEDGYLYLFGDVKDGNNLSCKAYLSRMCRRNDMNIGQMFAKSHQSRDQACGQTRTGG